MWKTLPYKGYIYFSIGLNALSIVSVLLLRTVLPPVVPLFYGLPAGTEQLAPSFVLVLAPAAGLGITVLNIFVCSLTHDIFLKRTLIIASTFLSLLVAIAVVKIILLVGFF